MFRRVVHTLASMMIVLAMVGCAPAATPSPAPNISPTQPPVVPNSTWEFEAIKEAVQVGDTTIGLIELSDGREILPITGYDPCQNIVDFNGKEAYSRAVDAKQKDYFLWTFGLNFEDPKPSSRAIGCFTLYQRVDQDKSYSEFSRWSTDVCSATNVTFNAGVANFAVGGTITCNIDLVKWVNAISTTLQSDELKKFYLNPDDNNNDYPTNNRLYKNFTMIASAFITEKLEFPTVLTLISHKIVSTGQKINLDLEVSNTGARLPYGGCNNSPKPYQYWWYDLRIQREAWLYSGTQVINYFNSDDNTLPKSVNVSPCYTAPSAQAINFDVGRTILWIGGSDIASSPIEFALDGILVDPTDSKPGKTE